MGNAATAAIADLPKIYVEDGPGRLGFPGTCTWTEMYIQ